MVASPPATASTDIAAVITAALRFREAFGAQLHALVKEQQRAEQKQKQQRARMRHGSRGASGGVVHRSARSASATVPATQNGHPTRQRAGTDGASPTGAGMGVSATLHGRTGRQRSPTTSSTASVASAASAPAREGASAAPIRDITQLRALAVKRQPLSESRTDAVIRRASLLVLGSPDAEALASGTTDRVEHE